MCRLPSSAATKDTYSAVLFFNGRFCHCSSFSRTLVADFESSANEYYSCVQYTTADMPLPKPVRTLA